MFFVLYDRRGVPKVFFRLSSGLMYDNVEGNDELRILYWICLLRFELYCTRFDLNSPEVHVWRLVRSVRPLRSLQGDTVLIWFAGFRVDCRIRQIFVKWMEYYCPIRFAQGRQAWRRFLWVFAQCWIRLRLKPVLHLLIYYTRRSRSATLNYRRVLHSRCEFFAMDLRENPILKVELWQDLLNVAHKDHIENIDVQYARQYLATIRVSVPGLSFVQLRCRCRGGGWALWTWVSEVRLLSNPRAEYCVWW